MKRLFVFVTVLAATLCFVPQLWAKTFYLKNGEQIEYQRYWQKEGRVFLLINRDTLVDFAPEEVDLAKTAKDAKAAGVKKKARHHKKRVKSPAAPKAAAPNASKVQEKTPAPAAGPVSAVKSAPVPVAAAKPAPASLKRQQAAAGPPVQGTVSSAKKPAGAAVVKPVQPPRLDPPAAKPAPPVKEAPTLSMGDVFANGAYILVLMVIMIVSMCKLFAKAGEAWWKALIPIYNLFVFVAIAGKPWWWTLLMLVPIVNIFIFFIIHIALAKRFGEGTLFGVGLALVGFIFFPLLAFGKSEYR